MRFLFSPVPVTGRLSPALPLMRRFVERGQDVRCYTGARFRDAVEATGAAHEPFRSAPDREWEQLNALFPKRPQRGGIAQARWDLKKLPRSARRRARGASTGFSALFILLARDGEFGNRAIALVFSRTASR